MSKSHVIYTIAVIGFIYTLHAVLPMYSNSSFLNLFVNEQTLGQIYMAIAAVSALSFLILPAIIRRIGNYAVSLGLICIQIALIYAIISSTSVYVIVFCFIIQSAVIALIGLTIDIFLEHYTDHNKVGAVRGLYTATLNASWLIGPLIGTMLIGTSGEYKNTYLASLAMLFPLLYLVYRNFPKFADPTYTHLSPWQLLKHISKNRNWSRLFVANIILQTFYSWMVVYSPIYLNKIIGLGWSEIGIILTIMLLPFPLIQYPLGLIADKKIGEKEIMTAGFVIMGLATISLSFITSSSVGLWAFALLVTRIGAAAAEIMIETYFFKTVPEKDTAVLGSFRVTRSVSYFLAPLITGFGLMFTSHQYLFIIIGLFCFIALYPTLTIKDTR